MLFSAIVAVRAVATLVVSKDNVHAALQPRPSNFILIPTMAYGASALVCPKQATDITVHKGREPTSSRWE